MDRDFDSLYEGGIRRGADQQPRATGVRYNSRTRRIDVELTSGMAISVPAAQIQGLRDATVSELKEGRVRGHGTALRWDSLDADIDVPALFRGILGSKTWMAELGRAGGQVTSPRKAAASRANGRKGGRPRKKRVTPDG